ncbi:MAG: hypothetical protein AB1489_30695 [Acidobacteriota bacterium]
MAKIRILVFERGQDINGELAMVGIISGLQQQPASFFFARMEEVEGRQHWLRQRSFNDESEALRYWRRRQPRHSGAHA